MRDRPAISVVVPAYRAAATLRTCVESLLAQEIAEPIEVVVAVSADRGSDLPSDLPEDDRLTVLRHVPRWTAASARNQAVAMTRGRLLAFTDANVIAPPTWLWELVRASDGGRRIVAGSVRNGAEWSPAATTEYLVEFIDLHPRRPARTAWHGAACNLLVPRELWERYGPWAELGGGEDTLLTVRARSDGVYTFAARAAVQRAGRTRMRDVVTHQFHIGTYSARLARLGPYKGGVLVRNTLAAPLAAAARVLSVYARVLAWTRPSARRSFALLPGVLAALAAWGAGVAVEGARIDLARWRRR